MDKRRDDNHGNLSCSFCGKNQKEVKKLIAGPTVYICDECIGLCNDIIAEEIEKEEQSYGLTSVPEARRDQGGPRRVRHRPGPGEEDPRRRGPQPLQAHRRQGRHRRRRAAEVEHPPARADRLRQDAAGADAGAHPQRAVRHRRRHQPHRGGLRRRGRREHHRQPAAERRSRHREGAARHRLHRRDRQDRAQERQPVDHARRLGRGRAAGAAQDHRGHRRERAAQGRPQASAAGVPAGRHHQHPLHLRRRVHRARGHHRAPRRAEVDGLRRRRSRRRTRRRSGSTSRKCSPRTC